MAAAREYCAWVAVSPSGELTEAHEALRQLSLMHSAALRLPPELPVADCEAPDRRADEVMFDAILKRFGCMPFGHYWMTYGPTSIEIKADVVVGDLRDNLAEVWRDLAEGLLHWDAGEPIEAVWTWGFGFRISWGRNCADALRALHWWFDADHDRWNLPGS